MASLPKLRTVAQDWLSAEKSFKQTGLREQETQAAFERFVEQLDARTVLALIEAVEAAQSVADLFIWLSLNAVDHLPGPTSVVEQELRFKWAHPANDPKTLGSAVRDAMEKRSLIVRAHG